MFLGEHREFVFTSESTADDAHVVETDESRKRRGWSAPESDPHVVEEIKTVEEQAQ
jgi:hypothetical protein